jgi:hypothetical protein
VRHVGTHLRRNRAHALQRLEVRLQHPVTLCAHVGLKQPCASSLGCS